MLFMELTPNLQFGDLEEIICLYGWSEMDLAMSIKDGKKLSMNLSPLVIGFYLTTVAALVSLPVPLWGQVRPALDPGIPTYFSPEPGSGTLTISVSETIQSLVRAWVDGLVLHHPKLKITVVSEGSGNGLAPLLEHRTEVAALPRRITAAEIAEFVREYGYEPTEVPVAVGALAIYVHKDNPIAGLSLDELDAMFCRERQRGLPYNVDSWGLVGVMDDWFEAPIRLYGRNGKSGISYFFREEVCKNGTFLPQLTDAPGSASAVLDVGDDPQGIGFGTIGYGTSMVKQVPIASVKGGRYVEPTVQAVMDGSYPLRRNLYLYIAKPSKASPTQPSAELVRYVLSQQGQQLALEFGYLSLPSAEITRLASRWTASLKAAQLETSGRPVAQ